MKPTAPDWPQIIAQIVATGMTELEIAKQPGVALTLKAIRYLAQEGRQPIFHRGECLVLLWCARTGNRRDAVPVADVIRGHRKARIARDTSPRLQSLPTWPAPAQRVDLQGKKRKVKEPA